MKIWERIQQLTAPSEHGLSPWYHGTRIALAVVIAVVTYLLFPSSPAVDFPVYEVGSVAPTRVVAPFAYDIPKDARELQREREEAARITQPVFNLVPAAADSAQRRLTRFMQVVTARAQTTDVPAQTRAIIAAADSFGVPLEPAEATYLASTRQREAIDATVRRAYSRSLAA